MNKKTLIIIQQHVLHWKTNKESIIQTITKEDADIILLNSTGISEKMETLSH